MAKDVYTESAADELTQKIVNRLGERQKKLERMSEWEQAMAPRTKIRPLYYLTAIAAGIALFLLVSPLWNTQQSSPLDELGIEAPTMSEFRAAIPEQARIAELMSEDKMEEALEMTRMALKRSDYEIKEMEGTMGTWDDTEEALYEEEAARLQNNELRWTYIYLLVRLDYRKEARKELKRYLKLPHYCEHEEEAKALLEKIKK